MSKFATGSVTVRLDVEIELENDLTNEEVKEVFYNEYMDLTPAGCKTVEVIEVMVEKVA